MTKDAALTHPSGIPVPLDMDDRRRAPWLLNKYTDSIWVVTDTHDRGQRNAIQFQFRLADGRSLINADRLYATVKEYAWWVRDSRYSRIDDASTHATMVRNLMNFAHALSLRNIWSFAHLQPYDLEQLIEDCRFGTDALIHASERVEAHLRKLEEANKSEPRPYGGLPPYVNPATGRRTGFVSSGQILAACNLPTSARTLRRVGELIARAAAANGLRIRRPLRNFADDLDQLPNVTVQALHRSLDPLEQLYAMRRKILAESIGFRPFPCGAARVAAAKGVGAARTPIPPPMLVLHLFEQSARCISDYDEKLKPSQMERCDVFRMASACWIVIAGFTARRDEEIDDLRHGCLRGDEQAGWWLHVYIEKTLQRKEWIPVPRLVARAVEIMSAISATARQEAGGDQLFQWLHPDSRRTVRIDVGRQLDEFAEAVHVPLHRSPDGSVAAWHWHPHQFRRFFAVLYFYRFEGATIEALSHHLRHFSLEMTKRYVTQDPEVAALWRDVEWGYLGEVARSIVAGERSVSGAAGERLKKVAHRLIDMFRRKLLIISPERVGASVALIMRRQGMVLTPKPWVICSCPRTRDAAILAACRREQPFDVAAVGPDFAHAGPLVCSSCPHAITQRDRCNAIDAEVKHLEAAAVSQPRTNTLLGALEEARVIELRRVRETQYEHASAVRWATQEMEGNE